MVTNLDAADKETKIKMISLHYIRNKDRLQSSQPELCYQDDWTPDLILISSVHRSSGHHALVRRYVVLEEDVLQVDDCF